jgi:hypothetical protein
MNPIFDLEPWLRIPHARDRATCAWPSIPMAVPTKTGAKIRALRRQPDSRQAPAPATDTGPQPPPRRCRATTFTRSP